MRRGVEEGLAEVLKASVECHQNATEDMRMKVGIIGCGQIAMTHIPYILAQPDARIVGLVDAIEWFRAPMILGDEGRPAVGEFVLNRLADAPRFKRLAVHQVGDDLWERYERL